MWSMWNAPSDRDYYNPFEADYDEDETDICGNCCARWDRGEACEDWCETNRPVPEPVPVSCLAVDEQEGNFFEEAQMRFRVWVTFRAASQAEASCRTAGPRRGFCAARMFELSDREFEELWPGLERLLNNTGRPWDALDVRPHEAADGG